MRAVRSLAFGAAVLFSGVAVAAPLTLSGVVKRSDGSTVGAATVYASSGGSMSTTTSGSNGAYSMTLASGSYKLDVAYSDTGFSTQGYGSPTPINLTSNTTQDLTLPTMVLHGRVVDTSATPVAGVKFHAIAFANNSCCGGFDTIDATSAADGTFTARVLPNSYEQVTLTPPTGPYAITSLPNLTLSGDTTQDFTIQKPFAVTGHVTFADGSAASNVTIAAGNVTGTTDINGAYSLSLAPGTYTLDAAYTDAHFSTQGRTVFSNLVVSAATVQDLVIPTITLSGRVLDATSAPVAGVTFHALAFATNSCCGGFDIIDVNSASDGTFTARILPSSYSQITLTPQTGSGYALTPLANETFNVDTSQDFTILKGDTISGAITYSDGPAAANATLYMTAGSANVRTMADGSGAYSLTVAPNSYTTDVAFTRGGFSTQGRTVPPLLTVAGDATVNLSVPMILLSVHVIDQDGLDVPNVTFTALAFAENSCCGGFDQISATTDTTGRFSLRILANSYTQMKLVSTEPGVVQTPLPDTTFNVDTNVTYTMQGMIPYDLATAHDLAGGPINDDFGSGADGPEPRLAQNGGCACEIGHGEFNVATAIVLIPLLGLIIWLRRRRNMGA